MSTLCYLKQMEEQQPPSDIKYLSRLQDLGLGEEKKLLIYMGLSEMRMRMGKIGTLPHFIIDR